MRFKLIALDMDGTLLDGKCLISEKNRQSIKKAKERGVYVVLATGRAFEPVEKFVCELGLENDPLILYNGAMVLLGKTKIFELSLEKEDSSTIVREARGKKIPLICWSDGKLYAEEDGESVRFYQKILGVRAHFVDSLLEVENVTKFVWFVDSDKMSEVYGDMSARFGDRFNVHPSRADFLEFVNKRCSKGLALEKVCEKLGVSRERTIAVGDGINDISMIDFAGLGAAMENAPKAVKSHADFVTSSCEKSGVSELIDRFLIDYDD